MKISRFKCVDMKRVGAAKIFKKISGMNKSEELAFWESKTSKLVRHKKAIKKRKLSR